MNRDGRTRDTQRQRVYDAEGVLLDNASRAARRFLVDEARMIQQSYQGTEQCSIEDCQRYVDDLVRATWFQSRFGQQTIRVHWKASGKATGSFGGGRMALPPWSRSERVILHEAAHNLVRCCRGGLDAAAHGPEFAAVLLLLVRHRMGPQAARDLRAAYRRNRVRVAPSATLPASGSQPVLSAAERRDRARARVQAGPGDHARRDAARTIRWLILDARPVEPHFGPAGSKPRRRATDTARLLSPAKIGGATAPWLAEDRIAKAAATVRAAAAAGVYGPAGRKPRTYALAVARRLDEIARGRRVGRQMVYAATPQRW